MSGLLLGLAAVLALAWVILARLQRRAGQKLARLDRPLKVQGYDEVEAFLRAHRECPHCAARLSRLGEDHVSIEGTNCLVVMLECDRCEDRVRYAFDVGGVPN